MNRRLFFILAIIAIVLLATMLFQEGKIVISVQNKPYPQHMYFVNYTSEDELFLNEIDVTRINRLFKILLKKEKMFNKILRELDLIMFSDLIEHFKNKKAIDNIFKNEIDQYLDVQYDHQEQEYYIGVNKNNKFTQYLYNLSFYYSFNESIDASKQIDDTIVS